MYAVRTFSTHQVSGRLHFLSHQIQRFFLQSKLIRVYAVCTFSPQQSQHHLYNSSTMEAMLFAQSNLIIFYAVCIISVVQSLRCSYNPQLITFSAVSTFSSESTLFSTIYAVCTFFAHQSPCSLLILTSQESTLFVLSPLNRVYAVCTFSSHQSLSLFVQSQLISVCTIGILSPNQSLHFKYNLNSTESTLFV